MALRMSLQEAQEREARERAGAGGDSGAAGESTGTAVEVGAVPKDIPEPINPEEGHTAGLSAAMTGTLTNANDSTIAAAPGDEDDDEYMDDDEDAMLARAMALSRGDNPDDHDILMDDGEDEEDEEAAIARAIAMSLQENKKEDDKDKK